MYISHKTTTTIQRLHQSDCFKNDFLVKHLDKQQIIMKRSLVYEFVALS